MKSRTSAENAERPSPKPWAISIPEIVLMVSYFLAVWLIPTSWLDTAVGAVAFAIASKVNPYLSEYSIAFAEDPQYFIHCHVLATSMLAPSLFGFVVFRNGGFRSYEALFMKSVLKQTLIVKWALYLFLFVLLKGMLWMVDYPLVRAERGVWVNAFGVAIYAFAVAALLSAMWYGIYFLIKSTLTIVRKGA
ncbi:hypothetical protein AAV94_12650 [Lampropedia cohaerens]|jgi:hypothetical protein|uniref:Uncharacterized protein n=1 Tax=Lampropedia cohaerens TaxID=1610491 RepID=A0A0U1PWZ3_9BURK|nr:hypothetical protein [Lampropedia cohaerens]KKW67062.1 hypothetical protein AAV94_12650 [Lampropedia cohaerens]